MHIAIFFHICRASRHCDAQCSTKSFDILMLQQAISARMVTVGGSRFNNPRTAHKKNTVVDHIWLCHEHVSYTIGHDYKKSFYN